jgi:leucyl aminopeptidase (aminopeptidase T)
MRGFLVAVVVIVMALGAFAAEPESDRKEKIASALGEDGLSSLFLRNARITLDVACLAKPGESVLILTDRNPERMACSRALEAAAVELGLVPVIMDVSAYGSLGLGKARRDALVGVMTSMSVKPVKNAVESADIVIRIPGMNLHYTSILGDPEANDKFLTAQQRRMQLQSTNMDTWEITEDEVAAIRRRTIWLDDRLRSVRKIRVTSPAGTDITVVLRPGSIWHRVLGIIPLYGEVAVIPEVGPETEGVYVVDGSTQMGVRKPNETDRPPLRFVVKRGLIRDMSGDVEQVARLKKLIAESGSSEIQVDEVGIVTTSIAANDAYWTSGRYTDGTHSHNSIHIALGNNENRGGAVHGILHIDGDVRRPTVRLDDQIIVIDGVFVDSVMD